MKKFVTMLIVALVFTLNSAYAELDSKVFEDCWTTGPQWDFENAYTRMELELYDGAFIENGDLWIATYGTVMNLSRMMDASDIDLDHYWHLEKKMEETFKLAGVRHLSVRISHVGKRGDEPLFMVKINSLTNFNDESQYNADLIGHGNIGEGRQYDYYGIRILCTIK